MGRGQWGVRNCKRRRTPATPQVHRGSRDTPPIGLLYPQGLGLPVTHTPRALHSGGWGQLCRCLGSPGEPSISTLSSGGEARCRAHPGHHGCRAHPEPHGCSPAASGLGQGLEETQPLRLFPELLASPLSAPTSLVFPVTITPLFSLIPTWKCPPLA